MTLHFSDSEFAARKMAVMAEMQKSGLDAMLIFRQESMYWLTGYDTFGYVFFQTLVLTADGDVVLMTRAPDLRQAQNTSNIADIRVWVDRDGASPADDLREILIELGLKELERLQLGTLESLIAHDRTDEDVFTVWGDLIGERIVFHLAG